MLMFDCQCIDGVRCVKMVLIFSIFLSQLPRVVFYSYVQASLTFLVPCKVLVCFFSLNGKPC